MKMVDPSPAIVEVVVAVAYSRNKTVYLWNRGREVEMTWKSMLMTQLGV
jgi:hypothetical protein